GMIQTDSAPEATNGESADAIVPASSEISNPVAARERHERHGHYPAVVLLEGRHALGVRLERGLFDRGFAALHLRGKDVSHDALSGAFDVARATGLVLIYSGKPLGQETRQHINLDFGGRVFDGAAVATVNVGDEEVVRQVLGFAQSLLLTPNRSTQRKKVN